MIPLLGQKPVKTLQDPNIQDITTASFETEVILTSMQTPVIVDFHAAWCGPCKTLGPKLEKAVAAQKGKVKLAKIDVDANPELAQALQIQSIPAVFIFWKGRPADGFMGDLPESEIIKMVEKLASLSGGTAATPAGLDIPALLTAAETALHEQDIAQAGGIFEAILAQDSENTRALAGMVKCLIAEKDLAAARHFLDNLPEKIALHADLTPARTALALAEQAQQAGPLTQLQAAVAANPKDCQALNDLAMGYLAQGDEANALETLLQSIRIDRAFNEEAARLPLLKLFESWGFKHPLSIEGRKKLSNILFS